MNTSSLWMVSSLISNILNPDTLTQTSGNSIIQKLEHSHHLMKHLQYLDLTLKHPFFHGKKSWVRGMGLKNNLIDSRNLNIYTQCSIPGCGKTHLRPPGGIQEIVRFPTSNARTIAVVLQPTIQSWCAICSTKSMRLSISIGKCLLQYTPMLKQTSRRQRKILRTHF